jgi:hypothetical protein
MRNSPVTVFARVLGAFLVGIGLLGGCWPFVERYLLTAAEGRASAIEASKLSEFFTYWLRASAIHWLVAGIGALLCMLTTGSDRRF